MPKSKIMVQFYCEQWALRDLSDEVGAGHQMVKHRWVRAGKPKDITGHDDILSPRGAYRRPRIVIIDGITMTMMEAAKKYRVSKNTVSAKAKKYGINIPASALIDLMSGPSAGGKKTKTFPIRKARVKLSAMEDRSPGWWERKYLAHVGTKKISTDIKMGGEGCISI